MLFECGQTRGLRGRCLEWNSGLEGQVQNVLVFQCLLSPKDATRNPCASCVNHPQKMHVVDNSCENHTCCCLSKIFQTISDDIVIYIYIVYRVCLSIGYPKNQWSIMIFPIQWPHFIVYTPFSDPNHLQSSYPHGYHHDLGLKIPIFFIWFPHISTMEIPIF